MDSKEHDVTTELSQVEGGPKADYIEQTQKLESLPDVPAEEKAAIIERLDAVTFEYTQAEEGRFLLKIDVIVLGYVSGAYMLAYMDRGNIGNANVAGMSEDLGLSDGQYEWCLTVLYLGTYSDGYKLSASKTVTCIPNAMPRNALTLLPIAGYLLFDWQTIFYKIFPARYYVPTVIIIWGTIAGCCAAAQNFAGLLVLRLLLGIFESAYAPGLAYFFSLWYERKEMARRLGYYVSIAPLAASFAGAFAYFVTLHPHSIAGWRALFLVEGLPSVGVGLFGYYWLPSNPQDCQFLTEKEKKIGAARTVRQTGDKVRSRKLSVREVLHGLLDVKNWITTIIYFCMNVGYSSLPIYVPTILEGMGYEALDANGLSAPPYIFAALVVLTVGHLSDRFQRRGYFLSGCAGTAAIGYLILCLVEKVAVKYFALFLVAGGLYPCIGLVLSWVANNNGDDSKRSGGFILMNCLGQCGPLLGTHIYPAAEAPHYFKGFWISFGACTIASTMALVQVAWLTYQNKKLDAKYGPRHIEQTAEEQIGNETDSNANFRYIL